MATKTRVQLTHPDREMFPAGMSKADVAGYYERVAGYMLPFLRDRPLVMQRFPEGIGEDGFYQKNASSYFPDWIQRVEVEKQGGSVHHVLCNDLDTLLYLVNQGCITFHTWLSRVDHLDHPDVMVFDLDPQKENDDAGARRGSLQMRELLTELDLECFVQATGSRGFHVDVPLDRSEDFDSVRAFGLEVAETLVAREPRLYTTEFQKSKRGDHIFVDTLRNAYAQTAVAPYSLRAKPGAPAATPLTWDEVERGKVTPRGLWFGQYEPPDEASRRPVGSNILGATIAESGTGEASIFAVANTRLRYFDPDV